MGKVLQHILAIILILCGLPHAAALDVSHYAETSRLAQGRWVKISVKNTGMHFISATMLRQMGFKDPVAVRVYGYGGARMSDLLSAETIIDDLPIVQTENTSTGIYFYARGTWQWINPDGTENWVKRNNPYALEGFYFLTEDSGVSLPAIPIEGVDIQGRTLETIVTDAVHYEVDRSSPGESGHLLLGEDFRFTPQQTFKFETPDRVAGVEASLRCVFFTRSTQAGSLSLTSDGVPLGSKASLNFTTHNMYGDSTLIRRTFVPGNNASINVGLNYTAGGVVTTANLDYLTLNYQRKLTMTGNKSLDFGSDVTGLSIEGADDNTRVWDVTNPLDITAMQLYTVSGGRGWVNTRPGMRRYAAWRPGQALYTPEYAGEVKTQNIHGEPVPDMIIIVPNAWMQHAERLAEMHRNSADSLRVLVVDPEKVYNEFGSGTPDAGAVRRMFKMFYDRGTDGVHRLQYALLMSRPTYDHRHLTEWMQTSGWETIPTWQTDGCADESYSYSTDDVLAMLEDGSGLNLGNDKLSIAIGRFPVRYAEEARALVDKTINYVTKAPSGDWKNKFVVMADDQDNGVHLEQADAAIKQMQASPDGENFIFNKVYIDAYPKIGGVTEGARTFMYRLLDEGSAWWWYVGHASIDTWTAEGMVSRTDLSNKMFFRHLPILYAPTCTFSRYDGSQDCGIELMMNNEQGGIIASLTPLRPVYISSNGVFTLQVAEAVMERDNTGRPYAIGEIFRRAKNKGRDDTNRLRYTFAGDPALRVPTPDNRLIVTAINGISVDDEDNDRVLMGQQIASIEGYVADVTGKPVSDFNGTVHSTIYDAEESVTSLGRGEDDNPGKECVFDRMGSRLYTGCDSVTAGKFKLKVAMPSEIAWNWRNATLNMYALADNGAEASGANHDFYVYGLDENTVDDIAPSIDALYLNQTTFKPGDTVNDSPMAFAKVSDDIGINLSQTGIGHTLVMRIDDATTFTDVSDYYTPAADGSPSGTVAYPLQGLSAGNHTLEFRVWDTSNNVTKAEIPFFVNPDQRPSIIDVYTDCNPATTQANFYVSHNRPDAAVTVTVTVYDIAGRPVWNKTVKGRSDMFTSTPVTWDLTDTAGRRVGRGIYVYRAELSDDGEHFVSEGRRLGVTR